MVEFEGIPFSSFPILPHSEPRSSTFDPLATAKRYEPDTKKYVVKLASGKLTRIAPEQLYRLKPDTAKHSTQPRRAGPSKPAMAAAAEEESTKSDSGNASYTPNHTTHTDKITDTHEHRHKTWT